MSTGNSGVEENRVEIGFESTTIKGYYASFAELVDALFGEVNNGRADVDSPLINLLGAVESKEQSHFL